MNSSSPLSNKVLVLDDSADICSLLDQTISKLCGRSVVTCTSLKEMETKKNEITACSVAFLDINLGHHQPTGIDALRRLKELGFTGQVFFLTGHAHHLPSASDNEIMRTASVLRKPISVAELMKILGSSHAPV